MEKRRQVAEESKANRQKLAEEAAAIDDGDHAVLDDLLEKLRNGESAGRKARRNRSTVSRPPPPLALSADALLGTAPSGNDTVDIAKDMLARLKSDGFETVPPVSQSTSSSQTARRSRRRQESHSFDSIG
ncbi:uncharacterized protein FIBRA_09056 [Fibroporia radiculosa]|uniref:DAD domain-containing protein n=1 Tax=Fibroporia radiculosa TaxID=599839 RepID=J4GIS8_9APHY|nr:uncharacterized protein FIBRA_09056 [Fibroporia radiculosa]CCM06758.1 predicted protein [Fibroporia radiculosa]